MKKTVFFLLITLISIFSFLIFHDKGNEIIKPYVSSYIESQLEQNMSVKVEHLKIDLDYVEFTALLNSMTKVDAKGDLSLFSKTLNIDYTLRSHGFKHKEISFEHQVDINGTVVGTFSDMKIQGEGKTLKSHINYALNLKDDIVNNIKVNINKADIVSLLQLTAQPAYATGKVDIDIHIPTLEALNNISNKGKATILLHQATLNQKVFKKELQINLPSKTIVSANIDAKVSAKSFELEGDIKTNLATLKLSNTTFDVPTKELIANYILEAPRLDELMFLTKQKLNGQLEVRGSFKLKNKKIQLNGSTKSLGGKIDFDYNGKKLNADMKSIQMAKLLHMLNEKPYATGEVVGKLKLSNLKNLTGTFELKTNKAKTINHTLKKELKIDFGKTIAFTLNTRGNIKSDMLNIKNRLDSELFIYTSNDMVYNLKASTLQSHYLLDIPKLSKLNALVGKPLKGQLVINGEINYAKNLVVTGNSKSLGGDIDFKLFEKKITSEINNVPVEKLMHLLSYPQVFKANIMGDFNYDLTTSRGKFSSTLNQAQLLSSKLSQLVKQIRGIDLTKERYNETHFNAKLNKDIIDIDFKAKSKKVLLSIPHGRINKVNNTINANYTINIDSKDIAGKIKGKISRPHISIDASKFIQDEIQNVMQGDVVDNKLKEFGLGTKETEVIKNLLGDLFK